MLHTEITKADPKQALNASLGLTEADSRLSRLAAIDGMVLRATKPHCFPKNNAAGPPDLRHPLIKMATRMTESRQPIVFGGQ